MKMGLTFSVISLLRQVLVPAFIPFFAFVTFILPQRADANLSRVQGRAFFSQINPEAFDLKSEMRSKGLGDFGTYWRIGFDFTYPVFDFLDLGVRYENTFPIANNGGGAAVSYTSQIDNSALQALARIPLIKTSFFRADVFGSYGLAATKLELRTGTASASISGGGIWTDSYVQSGSFGASVGIGFRGYFLYAEAGRSVNRMEGLDRTGTLATTLDVVDLSADYIAVGFIYDGQVKMGK